MPKTQRQPPPPIPLLAGSPSSGESNKAIQACNDWLRLGAGRTLPRLLAHYHKTPQNTAPTRSEHTLDAWSKTYGWAERAALYDTQVVEAAKNARRDRVLQRGLAVAHVRVGKLKRLAQLLETQLYEEGPNHAGETVYHNLWVEEVRQIGSGENAYPVYYERFNGSLVDHYRGVLDDLAKEVGQRRPPDKTAAITLEQILAALPDEYRSAVRAALSAALSPDSR